MEPIVNLTQYNNLTLLLADLDKAIDTLEECQYYGLCKDSTFLTIENMRDRLFAHLEKYDRERLKNFNFPLT